MHSWRKCKNKNKQKLFWESSSSGADIFGISKAEGSRCAGYDPHSQSQTQRKTVLISSKSDFAENKYKNMSVKTYLFSYRMP